MRRRLFNIAAAVSLLLCMATVILWVRSYGPYDAKVNGLFLLLTHHRGFQLISGEGRLSLFHDVPDGVTQIDFAYWRCAALFLVLPAAWLIRRLLIRPCSFDGRCAACGYNLTGNVSGVCPECGMPVRPDAEKIST